jgi:hypothetical protein
MSLADLSAQIRAALKWLLILPVILLLLWIVWLVAKEVSKVALKPRGQETAYGNLAPPFFTKTYSTLTASQFELAASLPKQKEKANVFQLQPGSKFSEKQQKELVSFFGLSGSEKKQSGNVTTWKNSSATFSLDTSQSHLEFRLDLTKGSSLLPTNASVDKDQAVKKAKEILKNLVSLPKDVDQDNPIVLFFSLSAEKRSETSNLSANAVEINFFRKVDGTRSSGDPLIRLLLERGSNKILEFDYHYYPLNPVASAYPIIDSSKAWEELQDGRAFTKESDEFDLVTATKINLSYWESKFSQPYLQPIWVFSIKGGSDSGEKEFEAYLPAIDPSFLWKGESPLSPP